MVLIIFLVFLSEIQKKRVLLLPLGILLHLSNIFSMKLYLKNFLPDFRPVKGSDASFDLRDFKDKDFICPIKEGDMGVYVISGTTKYVYPNGKASPVIYIGMSDNLFRRLKDEHFTKGLKRLIKDKDWGIEKNIILSSKYQYIYYHGSHVDVCGEGAEHGGLAGFKVDPPNLLGIHGIAECKKQHISGCVIIGHVVHKHIE